MVENKLELCWSPEQITGWPSGPGPAVPDRDSDARVGRDDLPILFVQARGDLRHELTQHLRTGRAMRRPAGARLPDGRGLRPNTLNI